MANKEEATRLATHRKSLNNRSGVYRASSQEQSCPTGQPTSFLRSTSKMCDKILKKCAKPYILCGILLMNNIKQLSKQLNDSKSFPTVPDISRFLESQTSVF